MEMEIKKESSVDKELHEVLCENLDRLYRFAYNHTRDAYKAEDLTQEIALSAMRSYHGIKDKDLILPWLWGVARNVYMRSIKPSREFPAEESFIIDNAGITYETPETKYIASVEMFNVRRAVSYLAKNYRDVAVMYYIEEKDYNTISQELDIPLSSVKWRLNQSKTQIREELETMEYMNDGYRKAQELSLNMGGWVGQSNWRGNYEGADKALDTLLAKNIAIFAYEKPVTVTEISSALGTSADYVEDIIEKMVETRTLEKSTNKYQTTFPIFNEKQISDIWAGNLTMAKEKAAEIFDMLSGLKTDIQDLGFHGCKSPFEKLLPMLISIICLETKGNLFEHSNLPFKGTDKAWYILGWIGDFKGISSKGGGLNIAHYDDTLPNCVDYYINNPWHGDSRSRETTTVLWNLFYGNQDSEFLKQEAHTLALLIESNKIEKIGNEYKIKIPILDENKGEYQKLVKILYPVIELSNKLQEVVNKRSLDTVRKHLPKRFDCDEFFGMYFSLNMIEFALFDLLNDNGVTLTSDMVSWLVLYKK